MTSPSNTGHRTLPLPDLNTAFPGPVPTSPHADHVEQQLLRWTEEFPLLAPADERRSLCSITGQGIARALPTADPDSLVLCAELFLWLVAFDDVHGEATAARDPALLVDRVGELIRVLADDDESADSPNEPFAAGLGDLLARFRARGTPTQYLRLTRHLLDNFLGLIWEAHNLPQPERVTVRTYCAMRPDTSFVRTIMATAPIALAYELSDEQQSSEPVRQLETAVAHLAGWVNDLASYARETERLHATPLSLPTLLMAEHRLDLPTAFAMASRMCEEQAEVARTRISELTSDSSPPLTLHAQALEHIAYSFIWHVGHDRYAESTTAAARTVALHPTTGSPSCP
ncbi:hypothetical protein ACIREO_22950 [Streptomyces sp. NPDC102441]|uniref:terpene synthase family protein n=1 Tax=Streptomyces sp. NPDC102441 TaxID=3366176 RepID=UPI00380AE066